MNGDGPGPTCASRLGHHWIDGGTNSLTRMGSPTPLGIIASMVFGALPSDPMMAKYNAEHVYSKAPEAATKRRIDLTIVGNDYKRGGEVSLENEPYLKRLVEIASTGKCVVGAPGALQFFSIRGGAEGFLPGSMFGCDARRRPDESSTTDGSTAPTIFDNNDLLVVFDGLGALIGAARLQRPIIVPGWMSEQTANEVYDSWDGKEVFIYRNTSFEIPYLGLGLRDGFRDGSRLPSNWKDRGITKGTVKIDLHKQEDTNGCIFIIDKHAPSFSHSNHKNIDRFEPKLILDILARARIERSSVGSAETPLGVMQVIEIK